jgi:hypothetical protein
MSYNGTANLIPFVKNDPRRINKPVGAISHEKRLRLAGRAALKKINQKRWREGKPPLESFDIHLMEKAYEKDNVLLKVVDKIYPNATPEKESHEIQLNKVEVYIEFGASSIQDKTQRPDSQGNFLDIEAGAMSPEQS